ncbi:MAG: DUF167 domain-containing protein [Candidatus ainarchaeum sp.]|nr:DUF167 domain-containing protein [Candidatus ainarchaeum sp.]
MIADVTAVPKSGRFSVSFKDGKVKIFLKSAAEGNKANLELVKELSKLLGAPVRIASGLTSRRKRIEIGISEPDWAAFLETRR